MDRLWSNLLFLIWLPLDETLKKSEILLIKGQLCLEDIRKFFHQFVTWNNQSLSSHQLSVTVDNFLMVLMCENFRKLSYLSGKMAKNMNRKKAMFIVSGKLVVPHKSCCCCCTLYGKTEFDVATGQETRTVSHSYGLFWSMNFTNNGSPTTFFFYNVNFPPLVWCPAEKKLNVFDIETKSKFFFCRK